ncbi:hypothetical protein Sliba_10670 [Streptomyces nigrescens]|uniref:Uncharacterized protein n=1 Tax=Streptomyces nigrescens TaxID=1920 RepID=A0A640TBR6_STRNI|nr:hypothetical protein Sliba_10670 [Streptomyces libani subsp. libani]
MGGDTLVPGSARLHLVDCLPLLRPEEQVFEAMLAGWRNQQLTRNLSFGYVSDQGRTVRAFARARGRPPVGVGAPARRGVVGGPPLGAGLRALHGAQLPRRGTTVLRLCDQPGVRLGGGVPAAVRGAPVQVVHDWNAAVHADEGEGEPEQRAFTRPELEAFFDYADEQVVRVRGKGRKGLAADVPGRDAVQDGLRLWPAPQRDPHAQRGRLRPQPARSGVRRLRHLDGATREGEEGLAA